MIYQRSVIERLWKELAQLEEDSKNYQQILKWLNDLCEAEIESMGCELPDYDLGNVARYVPAIPYLIADWHRQRMIINSMKESGDDINR